MGNLIFILFLYGILKKEKKEKEKSEGTAFLYGKNAQKAGQKGQKNKAGGR